MAKAKEIKVATQAEFDACVKAGNIAVCISGHFEASGRATVRAFDSATVTAFDSATVEASDSATVTASGSATVTAFDSATVTAFGRVFVRLFSALKITATAQVVILREPRSRGDVDGGHVVQASAPKTAAHWCEDHGVEVKDGIAILYKGVSDAFISPRGGNYRPGTTPMAPDWDGGQAECGGGLHFSPRPAMTLQFANNAERFVACPVALADMRAPKDDDEYPAKIKARGCCAPVWEVSLKGERIKSVAEGAAK